MKRASPYPIPGPVGGKLIRDVIAALRATGKLSAQHTSHIHVAVSGGPDSLALARLLTRYGRKVGDPARLRILHIDHGWRKESARDARAVEKFAKQWGISFRLIRAGARAKPQRGQSWEDAGRAFRKQAFRKLTGAGHLVLTAHTADDLAETVLWRLLTGTSATHGAGILADDDGILRPLLGVRKRELLAFLQEERLKPLKDLTNLDPRFLRTRLRQDVFPELEKIFPRAVEHLGGLARQAARASETASSPVASAVSALRIPARAAHYRALAKSFTRGAEVKRTFEFPDGWRLTGRGETWRFERRFERKKPRKSTNKSRKSPVRPV